MDVRDKEDGDANSLRSAGGLELRQTKRWPRRRRVVLFVLLGTVVAATAWRFAGPSFWKRQLAAQAAGADRITIDSNVAPRQTGAPMIEVVGAEKVEEFFRIVRFKPALLPWHCMCFGEAHLRFYRGSDLLLTLSFHHGESLRVHDEKWRSNRNMELTDQSRLAMARWLEQNGYRSPQ